MLFPVLNESELGGLRDVGQAWGRSTAGPSVWRRALPVDPALGKFHDDLVSSAQQRAPSKSSEEYIERLDEFNKATTTDPLGEQVVPLYRPS